MQSSQFLQSDPRFKPAYTHEEPAGTKGVWTYYSCMATGWKGKFYTRTAPAQMPRSK